MISTGGATLRLLVCEYVTGGGMLAAPLTPGLLREGDMMLAALIDDLIEVPGLQLLVCRDPRLPMPKCPVRGLRPNSGEDGWTFLGRCIAMADAVWPIAPETGGVLERLTGTVLDAGRILLGSGPDAVRLTTSKLATADRLAAAGVPMVPTFPGTAVPDGAGDWVVKPDDGAGTEDTLLLSGGSALRRWLAAARDGGGYVVQPFLDGAPASLSVLCRDGEAWVLSCNRQRMSIEEGRFRYLGGTVGGLEPRRATLAPLAAAVAAAIPELWGHVGIDLVDRPQGPVVVEVNPRLTTSYVGLKRAIGANPAALVLQLLERPVGELQCPLSVGMVELAVGDAHER
jgi:predicted ATP-grasp superfamily ATP-dependent carboligase